MLHINFLVLSCFILLTEGGITLTTPDPAGNGSVSTGLLESSPAGTVVETLSATTSEGPEIHFFIISQTRPGAFEIINSLGGAVTVANEALVDREDADLHYIAFNASDGITYKLGTLVVPLLDVNDNAPVFGNGTVHINIANGLGGGAHVTTLQPKDNDVTSANNRVVSFALISGNTNSIFTLDSITGEIKVTLGKVVDANIEPVYNLIVSAADSGTSPGPLTGTGTIRVCVGCHNKATYNTGWSAILSIFSLVLNFCVC